MGQVTEEQNSEIAEKLRVLRQAAWKPEEPVPASGPDDQSASEPVGRLRLSDRMEEKWQIQERPFVSHMPLIGPLIVRLREAWNRISTKWYVLPLIHQQNELNWLVMRRFRELDGFDEVQSLAQELDERVLVDDREAMELAREMGELTYAVVRMEKRLSELEARLDEIASSSGKGS